VATDGERRYAELVALSAGAVKRIHPKAKIIVLTDDRSWSIVKAVLKPHGFARSLRSVGAFSGEMGPRSRFVKTQVRQFVEGDFIYLDADAIPLAAFDQVFHDTSWLVSAAIDRSLSSPSGSGFPSFAVAAFDRLGWAQPTQFYLNCGVTCWKDTPITRRLGKAWHDNWRIFFEESNDYADQPAFNYSLVALGISPGIMHDKYNARVGLSADFARDAIIYHFYASDRATPGYAAIESLLAKFRSGVTLDVAVINLVLAQSRGR
jgi:hypothetical protein